MDERQDWQRLNWLEDMSGNLPVSIEKLRGKYVIRLGRVSGSEGRSLREAIDEAIKIVPEPA